MHGRTLRIPLKSPQEPWVRLELRRPSIKLPHVAQGHPRPAMHRVHQAADIHVHFSVFVQLAHVAAVLVQAYDGAPALRIGSVGRTEIDGSGHVWKLHNVIDMRGYADVFVEILLRLFRGYAWFGTPCENERREQSEHRGNSPHRT